MDGHPTCLADCCCFLYYRNKITPAQTLSGWRSNTWVEQRNFIVPRSTLVVIEENGRSVQYWTDCPFSSITTTPQPPLLLWQNLRYTTRLFFFIHGHPCPPPIVIGKFPRGFQYIDIWISICTATSFEEPEEYGSHWSEYERADCIGMACTTRGKISCNLNVTPNSI